MATYLFWDPVEDNIIQERDESGALTAEYTAEPGLYGNIISQNRSGVESQFHHDAQGSTLAVTDDDQNVTDTFAYTAFGEVTERTGTTDVPFQYIGQKGYYTDGLTGQMMVRRRPYEPASARWLSADPLFAIIEQLYPQYWYTGNRPLTLIDPTGLVGEDIPACGRALCLECFLSAGDDPVVRKIAELIPKNCKHKIECCDKEGDEWMPRSEPRCKKFCEGGSLFGVTLESRFPLALPHIVILCANNIKNPSSIEGSTFSKCKGVYETLAHELIHLYDICTSAEYGLDNKCARCLCKEIRAFLHARNCVKENWDYLKRTTGHVFHSEHDCLRVFSHSACKNDCERVAYDDFWKHYNYVFDRCPTVKGAP